MIFMQIPDESEIRNKYFHLKFKRYIQLNLIFFLKDYPSFTETGIKIRARFQIMIYF